MYLSTLSGAIVALSLIGGVDGFHDAFFVVALVVLPVVLFVGIGTWLRMGATNYHDAITVIGMNRIRAAYLEIAPDLAPYFVMGVHDDAAGVGITMAVPPGTSPIVHLIAGTPTLVMVLNGVVSGAIAALGPHPVRRRGRRDRARGWPRPWPSIVYVLEVRSRALEDPPGAAGPRADVPDAVGGPTARTVTVEPVEPVAHRRHPRRAGGGVPQLPFRTLTNPFTPLEVLSADQVEDVHRASLRILAEVGVEVLGDRAIDRLAAAGATVDRETRRVRLDPGLVEERIATAPATFTLHARNPRARRRARRAEPGLHGRRRAGVRHGPRPRPAGRQLAGLPGLRPR